MVAPRTASHGIVQHCHSHCIRHHHYDVCAYYDCRCRGCCYRHSPHYYDCCIGHEFIICRLCIGVCGTRNCMDWLHSINYPAASHQLMSCSVVAEVVAQAVIAAWRQY